MSVTASDYYFIKVPAAIQDLKLSASEGWVLVMLLSHGAKPGIEVYPSDERLMSMTLLDKKTIHASIEALAKKNIIQVKREKFSDKKVYVINHPDEWGLKFSIAPSEEEKKQLEQLALLKHKVFDLRLKSCEIHVFYALLAQVPTADVFKSSFSITYDAIEEMTHLSRPTIARAIASLNKKNVLTYRKGQWTTANVYSFNLPSAWKV